MKSLAFRVAEGLVLPLGLIALWWVLSAHSTSPYYPPLREDLDAFFQIWFFDRFRTDLEPTVVRFVIGFAIAVVVGIASGTLLGLSARARRDISPITEFLRATPIAALVPAALVILGPGTKMEVALIAFGSLWPILISTADGVRSVDAVMLETARSYGVSPWRQIRLVVLPAALPRIFAGLRIGVSIGIAAAVIANMFASNAGLGFFVIDAQSRFDIKGTWAGLFMIGLVGLVANLLLVAVQHRALRWHRGWRAAAGTN